MKRVLLLTITTTVACGGPDGMATNESALQSGLPFSQCRVLRDDRGAVALFATISPLVLGLVAPPHIERMIFRNATGDRVLTIVDVGTAELGGDPSRVFVHLEDLQEVFGDGTDYPTSVQVVIDGRLVPACTLAEFDILNAPQGTVSIDTTANHHLGWDGFEPGGGPVGDYGNCPDCVQTFLVDCFPSLYGESLPVSFGPGAPIDDCGIFDAAIFP